MKIDVGLSDDEGVTHPFEGALASFSSIGLSRWGGGEPMHLLSELSRPAAAVRTRRHAGDQ